MNVALLLSIISAMTGIGVAVLASRISRAPTWAHKRYFALVSLAATTFVACDAIGFADMTPESFLLVMRLQGAAAALHAGFWILYAYAHLGLPRTRAFSVMLAACGVATALWLVPGLMCRLPIVSFTVPWFHAAYRTQTATAAGTLAYALCLLALVVPLGLYVGARHRVRGAIPHAVGVAMILACGVFDTVVLTVPFRAPYLTGLGFLVSIVSVGLSVTTSFVDSARELDVLTEQLERLVVERTRKLVDAEVALARAAKVAAVGNLSAGVAHEINNPAAAVAANLDYLRSSLVDGALPEDALLCLDECADAVERIASIVRQLLDSSRSDAASGGRTSVGRAVERALERARPRLGEGVRVEVDAPTPLSVSADEASLVRVLENLLVNGAEAIPHGQEIAIVRVKARERLGTVTIEVHDNGAGMSGEVEARVFDPFFTTKAPGLGTGLGLSVSLGLVRSMGGDIEIDTAPGHTTMRVHLPSGSRAREDESPSVTR
jgi:signal transduction histidine kinase